MSVIIGIDPHKSLHAVCAIDHTEAQLAHVEVRATSRQLVELLAWASPFTYIFEFVRFSRPADYWQGLMMSFVYLALGCSSALVLYRLRRSRQGLMDV